jgi:hypothetical protein
VGNVEAVEHLSLVCRHWVGPTDLVLSCRAAFVTEPAVPLTAGGQVSMVAPTLTRSKSRSARPCQLQHHVRPLR